MRKILSLFLLAMVAVACSDNKQQHTFKEYKWKAGENVNLEFEADQAQKVFFEIRSYYGFPILDVPMNFELKNEQGQKINFSRTISFREENMDCTGDFCDQRLCLIKMDTLKSEGDFKLKVSKGFKNLTYLGLMEMRVVVE